MVHCLPVKGQVGGQARGRSSVVSKILEDSSSAVVTELGSSGEKQSTVACVSCVC